MTPTNPESSCQILKTDIRGRVRLPRDKQEALLDEFEKSGMSGQAFAAWAGVKYPTFAYWRQKRRKALASEAGAEPTTPMRWEEAVVAQAPASGALMVIHLPGGVRVEASSGRQAAEFVAALGSGRC
jgi:hypothetical protein